jgi:hypothetical protein
LHKIGSENAHGCAQNVENGFDYDFLERYHKDGDEILIHIVRITDDETWFSFVNFETTESESSGCTQIHQTSRKNLNKRCPPANWWKLFLGQEWSAYGGIHATRSHNNVRTV